MRGMSRSFVVAALFLAACDASSGPATPGRSDSGVFGGDAGERPVEDGGVAVDERCDDGLDNDLDGAVDEGCRCTAGDTQSCYLADPATEGVGACTSGTQTCAVSSEFPRWGACDGATGPSPEACFDGIDNDCDGLTDCEDSEDCGTCPIDCELTHDYGVELVGALGGAASLESCGPGCADLWVGRVGDNYWSGSCSIFEEEARVTVLTAGVITSATLERAKWDDYMRIHLNEAMVWSGPDGNFPPETGGACELGTSWDQNPGLDLTTHFSAAGEIRFRIRVSVTGGGEGFARIRLRYDPSTLIEERGWSDAACVAAARRIADGCTGTVTCTDGPTDGCVDVGGVVVCEGDVATALDEPPHPDLSRLCRRASVSLTDC